MLLSKNYVSEFGREGETCTLRGHTAPLQTATATTYGPTSLYFLIIPHIVDLAHLSFFVISICFIPCSNISITFSPFLELFYKNSKESEIWTHIVLVPDQVPEPLGYLLKIFWGGRWILPSYLYCHRVVSLLLDDIHHITILLIWLASRKLNPDFSVQSRMSYHWTTRQ